MHIYAAVTDHESIYEHIQKATTNTYVNKWGLEMGVVGEASTLHASAIVVITARCYSPEKAASVRRDPVVVCGSRKAPPVVDWTRLLLKALDQSNDGGMRNKGCGRERGKAALGIVQGKVMSDPVW